MLRFFSKVRYKLADEYRVYKYLRYAIGEILLVVIGILIALQINNWNEGRKKAKMTAIIYQELVNNIKLDIADIKFNMKSDSGVQNSITIVLDILNEKPPYDTTMPQHFGEMSKYTNFFDHKSAYENLKSIGFDFISNESLRFAIIKYYDGSCNYLVDIENNIINPHEENFVQPFMIEYFHYSSFFEPAYPNDYDNLLKQEKLKSILSTKHRLFEWKRVRGQNVIDEAEKLNGMINDEIIKINQ